MIEALVLGHLPITAGPWAAQYARAAARADGRGIALARLAGDELAITLFGAHPPAAEAGPSADEREALARAAGLAGRWILHVDEPDEPELIRAGCASAVTLLAGANEAAVVGAYRTIKSLCEHAGLLGTDSDSPSEPRDPPEIRVSIMGAEGERAEEVSSKIRRAALSFLGLDIEVAPGVARIGPSGGVPLYRGRTTHSAASLAGAIRGLRAPGPTAHAPARPEPAQPEPEPPSLGAEAPLGSTARAAGPLATLLPGLRPLALGFPHDASIELAIAEYGMLHLLRPDDDEGGAAALLAASAWAEAHAPLLQAASGGAVQLRGARPVLHLFTRNPVRVRRLLDTAVRVHLLVGAAGGEICIDLN